MPKKSCLISMQSSSVLVLCLFCAILQAIGTGVHGEAHGEEGVRASGPLVKREQRRTLFSTEDGEISAVRVADNINGSYLIHFFTLEPNSLFLPAVLHADMVFYVHTGSGKLSWTEEDDLKSTELRRGDVYRLEQGAFFFIQSNLETETERQKLRIHALFANSKNDLHEPAAGPYSSIRDMVLGFDKQVLQAAFKVPEEVIEELLNGTNLPAIIHGPPRTKKASAQFLRSLLGSRSFNIFESNKKKKKSGAKLFNLFQEDKDFENCNGWSTAVTRKKLSALKGSDIGVFMVNLTVGSMMGPHWNPKATEIAVVLQGRGMIRVVCSSISNETRCRNMRFKVEEGDVFAVPRYHPMAQISFNNETLVFLGFSTSAKKNHPQFLAGQASVFRTLDKDILAMSFNVTNTTLDRLLAAQHDSVILGCVSCAEEELSIMEEEIEKESEEAREREEEEMRRREKERRREEEEARKREEEAARREEEERRRREEKEEEAAEARKREEEAARREEEERKRREEKEEEEAEARREEEERERREQEERERREEEARRREQEEKERKEEEAARREQEGESQRREEEERQREEEEESTRQREEEARQREEEQAEERRREEEKRTRREEEERQREEEEAREREQEQEAARRREEEEQEEKRRREEQRQRGRSEEERAAEEEARREEEAQREEEEARRRERERGDTELEGENYGGEGWGTILKMM